MSSFKDDVESLLMSFIEIHPHRIGDKTLYSTHLTPYMLNGYIEQKLPPGQIVALGPDGYDVRAAEYDEGATAGDWAARPRFKDFESARRMIIGWIFRERRDIVRACIAETRAARIWRAKQAATA